MPVPVLWRRGLSGEVAFWEHFVRTRGVEWPEEYQRRFTPGVPIVEPLIVERLPLVRSRRVSILDVGAGPASSLGSALPDRELELVAIDPLADQYRLLLRRYNVTPPVPVLACRGEDILARFGAGRFDIAHARNSLDHSADPATVARNMMGSVRPRGFVILRHWRNEGKKAGYEELHQWDIDILKGELVVANRRARYSISAMAAALEFDQELAVEGTIVTGVFRRRAN